MPTPNIGLTQPASGTTPWDGIVNNNSTIIDNCFGGTQTVPAVVATSLTGTTVKNSNLTAASSGNTATLLNVQGPAAPITGTGAAATMYTYTLPGNTMRVGTGIRITVGSSHSTGTASVTYTISYGGSTLAFNANAATGQGTTTIMLFNIGATNAQRGMVVNALGTYSNNVTNPSTAIDSTANQTILVTFTVAATDQVTPELFVVELIQ